MGKDSNLLKDKLPTIQKTAVLKDSFNKITNIKINAEKKAPIITPESSRILGSKSPNLLPRKKTKIITKKAPTKAKKVVPKKDKPNKKDKTAPNVPPLEIPKIYGSASGFIKIDWNTAPVIDKPPPIIIAYIILGNLISNIILFNCSLELFVKIKLIISFIEISTEPIERHTKPATIVSIKSDNIWNVNFNLLNGWGESIMHFLTFLCSFLLRQKNR